MQVDVIKHVESGVKYILVAGSELPSNAYVYIRRNISEKEAQALVPTKKLTKERC